MLEIGYQRLIEEICKKAREDYKMSKRNPECNLHIDCVGFYESEWFSLLTGFNGKEVMKRLDGC